MSNVDMSSKVADFLQARLPKARNLVIRHMRRVAGGLSTENWLFDAAWDDDTGPVVQPLVVRCSAENEIVQATRNDEFEVMRAMHEAGINAPRVFWIDEHGKDFGRPAMVVERRPGRTERSLLQERNSLGLDRAARREVARQLAQELGAIHAVDANTIPHLSQHHHLPPAERELALQKTAAREAGFVPQPELVLAEAWLGTHLPPPPAREVVVHGDFRPANVLVEEGRITAVLDWELAHRGDPAEDIGWYLAPIYAGEHFISGAWEHEDFLRQYEQRSRMRPSDQAIRFWSVFAVYKLAIIASRSRHALAAGDHGRMGPPPYRLIEVLMRSIASPEFQ